MQLTTSLLEKASKDTHYSTSIESRFYKSQETRNAIHTNNQALIHSQYPAVQLAPAMKALD